MQTLLDNRVSRLQISRVLTDGVVRLEPFRSLEDFDYLYYLAQDDIMSGSLVEDVVSKYSLYLWSCYDESSGIKGGVACISRFPWIGYTFDAYKDDKLAKSLNNKADYSYRVGKLVMDYFFGNVNTHLFVIFPEKNRPTRMISRRLGFKMVNRFQSPLGMFNLMIARKGE